MPTHVLRPDEGRVLDLAGVGVRSMVDAARTGGSFSLVEHPIAPRTLGSPIHTHTREDEYSYILEGRVGLLIGDDEFEATPGELVFKPRGVPHAFWNATDQPARLLEIISPAGFEHYFAEAEPLFRPGAPDMEAFAALSERYALQMDFGSVPKLAARHKLDMPPRRPGEVT
ncbi:MAG: cupin domain-containing protein [Chloroflexia bacterium]|nr:cupin domain-containing protein [Chloroflexia bacterium]